MNAKRIAAAAVLLVLSGTGCMDEGFDGNVPPVDVFLDRWGCVTEDTQTFPVFVDFGVSQLNAVLEVYQGAADLILGVGEAPLNYFSLGRGPGTQRLLVGPESNVPVQAGTWFARVAGAGGVSTECDPDSPTDWHLVVGRYGPASGTRLYEQSCRSADCAVPACAATPCSGGRRIAVTVPADAGVLEVAVNSLEGDADLFLRGESDTLLGASANPGPGFDIVRLGPDAVAPLRSLDLIVHLASWSQVTGRYDLTVSYLPGGPAPEPE